MKRHRHTPEQIVRKLREGERLLNEGKDLTEVVRHLGIAESTWNRWRSQYGA
jgi:putative transposase